MTPEIAGPARPCLPKRHLPTGKLRR
jgi:hypothetical protein